MNKTNRDRYIEKYQFHSEENIHYRSEKSATHLLAALSFRVSADVTVNTTGNFLLPPIGHYYSLFHLAVCLCWLDMSIEPEKMNKLKHSVLKNLIKQHFIEQKILDPSFLVLMQDLQEEREWLNYRFGEFSYDFKQKVLLNEYLLAIEFKQVTKIIHEINEVVKIKIDIVQRIRTYITDSKGDDFMDTYLTDCEQRKIIQLLLEYGLTN
jgi:hypothetical protein